MPVLIKQWIVLIFISSFSLFFSTGVYADATSLLTGKPAEAAPEPIPMIETNISRADDQKIDNRLQQIFNAIDTLKTVKVATTNGVVTLSGEVESQAAADKAVQFARQTTGVVEVNNQLTVNRSLEKRLNNTWAKLKALGNAIISNLPIFMLAVAVLLLFWWMGKKLSQKRSLYKHISNNYFIASLVGQLVQLLFVFAGLMLALNILDATSLMTTILSAAGIVGLAISFAVRDTVENYIASILLSLRNPFEVNDLVKIENQEGRVAKLTSRATMLISLDGNNIRIPNSTVYKAIITNYTRNRQRRFQFVVNIDRGQDILKVQALVVKTLKTLNGVLAVPQPAALLQELGDASVPLQILGWVDQANNNFQQVRSEAIRAVKQALAQAGIVNPAPVYQVSISQAAGQTSNASDEPNKKIQVEEHEIQNIHRSDAAEQMVKHDTHPSDEENLLNSKTPKEM
jgi:small-conductance mechanosensitive channel